MTFSRSLNHLLCGTGIGRSIRIICNPRFLRGVLHLKLVLDPPSISARFLFFLFLSVGCRHLSGGLKYTRELRPIVEWHVNNGYFSSGVVGGDGDGTVIGDIWELLEGFRGEVDERSGYQYAMYRVWG